MPIIYSVEYVCESERALFFMSMDGGNPLKAAQLVIDHSILNTEHALKNWSFGQLKSLRCAGCKDNLANQLAHTDFGGCLYEHPDDPVVDQTGLVYPMPEVWFV